MSQNATYKNYRVCAAKLRIHNKIYSSGALKFIEEQYFLSGNNRNKQ
jgi:hypothetical protein